MTTAVTLKRAIDDPATSVEAIRVRNALIDKYAYAERHIGDWPYTRAKAALVKRKRDADYTARTAGDDKGEIAEELAAGDKPPCLTELADLVLFGKWLGEATKSQQPEELCDAIGSAVWYLPRPVRLELAEWVRTKLRDIYAANRTTIEGRSALPAPAQPADDGPPEPEGDPSGGQSNPRR